MTYNINFKLFSVITYDILPLNCIVLQDCEIQSLEISQISIPNESIKGGKY